MGKLLSKVISFLKKESFEIDLSIPDSYLFSLFIDRILMACRGVLFHPRKSGRLYLGKKVILKMKKMIRSGDNVSINDGCQIDALSIDGILIGNNVSIQNDTVIQCTGSLKAIGKGLLIGNNVGIGSYSFFGCAGGIEIGDDTIIGNYVSFHAENHNFEDRKKPIRTQGVNRSGIKVGNGCWIGAKATILDGALIEDGCIITAGSVVTKGKYSSYGIYGGIPARLLKMRPE